MALRPCLVCDTPTPTARCPAHRTAMDRTRPSNQRGFDSNHRRLRREVLAEESRCWRCGGPPTMTDPFELGHVVPRALGGPTVRENVHAEHASCNREAGRRLAADIRAGRVRTGG